MTRRAFLASACAAAAAAQSRARTPNVILIFADDLGYGDLGVFGNPVIRTPNLDRMAAEGVKLTNFYSAAPNCSPSRSALMTGRYPIRSGMVRVLFPNEKFGLPQSEITVAEVLRQNGYRTCCIGKWHMGDLPEYRPNKQGFDHYFGLHYSNDMDEEFHKRPLPYRLTLYRNEEAVEAPAKQTTLTRRYTEEAQKFIRDNRSRPFFIYLPHSFPHWPWFASEKFHGKSAKGPYGDTVEEVDWSAGEILRTLKETGLERDTLVIFTSDNGAAARADAGSNGLLRGAKGSTWEGGMREPFIARWPGRIPPGTTQQGLSCTMDLFTTIVELTGGKVPSDRDIDGKNILPLLTGEGPSPRDEYCYFDGPWDSRTRMFAFRSGHWKLHFRRTPQDDASTFIPNELYDLNNDPSEKFNLISKNAAVAERLTTRAKTFFASIKPGRPCPPLEGTL